MSKFTWGDGDVYIALPTGRTRTYYFYLKSLMGVYDMPTGFDRESYEQALYLLSRTERVDGNIGFAVPMQTDATESSLKAFCDNLLDADETLFLLWNSAVINTRAGGNDPDLLPPEDVPDQKKAVKMSKQSGGGSD